MFNSFIKLSLWASPELGMMDKNMNKTESILKEITIWEKQTYKQIISTWQIRVNRSLYKILGGAQNK